MLNSINSQAQAQNELQSINSPVMRRVLSGEAFRVSTDRIPQLYRIYNDAFGHLYLYCGSSQLSACRVSCVLEKGFVVRLDLLGESRNISVLSDTILFDSDKKGGAQC